MSKKLTNVKTCPHVRCTTVPARNGETWQERCPDCGYARTRGPGQPDDASWTRVHAQAPTVEGRIVQRALAEVLRRQGLPLAPPQWELPVRHQYAPGAEGHDAYECWTAMLVRHAEAPSCMTTHFCLAGAADEVEALEAALEVVTEDRCASLTEFIRPHRRARLYVHARSRVDDGAVIDRVGTAYEGLAHACAHMRQRMHDTVAATPSGDWHNWVWEAFLEPPHGGDRGQYMLYAQTWPTNLRAEGASGCFLACAGEKTWLTDYGPNRHALAEAQLRDRFPDWLQLHGDPESLLWIDIDSGELHERALTAPAL